MQHLSNGHVPRNTHLRKWSWISYPSSADRKLRGMTGAEIDQNEFHTNRWGKRMNRTSDIFLSLKTRLLALIAILYRARSRLNLLEGLEVQGQ